MGILSRIATRHGETIPREIMKLASIATLMGGASAFVDVDKTSISIPEVGKDLFVSCEGTRMEAKITKDYISKNTQWLGNGDYIVMGVMDMTSDWEDCKGKRDADGNVILSITDDFTKCGTRVEQVTDSSIDENGIETQVVTEYKFINHIVNDEVGDGFSIVNRTLDLVEFTCSYPTVQMTTGEINPLIQSALEKSKTKEIKGDMRLYKSNNYTDFYTEPPVLGLEEVLYVEVNLERPLVSDDFAASTDFAVVMEHCWGTPHDNRNGDMKYFIIKNQCPVSGDASLEVESNGENLTGRFNIKMFKFIGDNLNDVWLHCTVRACNTTADSCVPDCDGSGRERRDANRALPFLSLGHDMMADLPIQRARSGEEDIFIIEETASSGALEPGSTSFSVMIAVAAVVVALVFVFGITCMVAKRRRTLK